MAADSSGRKTSYLRHGCNAFDAPRPMSTPLGAWLEHDIWDYLKQNDVPYSSIYDMGYTRTGCMFGVHLEPAGQNRFQIMKRTHPKQYEYCINRLQCGKVLDTIGVAY
jgi:3'-phosphoadenosine 5'-phosphosulfate sulfotransferase (PAPS reductase)/FAD synthetase